MDQILEQLPIVLRALNIGFLQTLKLFFVTLIGAFPLGLIIAFGSMSRFKPLSYFTKFIVWIIRGTPLMIQLLIIYYFPGLVLHNPIWGGGESGRFLAASVSFILNYHVGKGHFPGPHHCPAGNYLGRAGVHERLAGNLGSHLADVLHGILLSAVERRPDRPPWAIRKEIGLFQIEEKRHANLRSRTYPQIF